jgi:general secretion pathway protein D
MHLARARLAAIRLAAACITVVALIMLCVVPALAQNQLASVRVTALRNGGARIFLSVLGGIPRDWHITGSGSTEAVIVLPHTAPAPSLQRLDFPGANTVSGVTVTPGNGELDIAVQLSAPVRLTGTASGLTLRIDVGPAPIVQPTAGPQSTPAPASGASTAQQYEVVPLKYADVSEVAGVLVAGQQIPPNDQFQPQPSIFSLPTSVNGTGPTQQTSFASTAEAQPAAQTLSFGERINDNIAIDRRLNAIVLSGTPQDIAALKAVIAKIDVPLPSVMLECEVVELSQTAAHDLGLDFTGGTGGPVVSGGVSVLTGSTPQFHANLAANLFATIARGGGQILATPRVLAVNGTPAQILTGDALPIITTTTFPGPPIVTQQTVTYIAVGVNLQIQPRITQDGFVTSHIYAEVSSVTAFIPTQQGNVPQISLRQTSTTATVADGQPFAVGGLLKDEEIENMSRVPGLGSLPIIGGLFRVRHDTTTKTNLFIFITPHIIARTGSSIYGVPQQQLPKPQVPGPYPARQTPPPSAPATPLPSPSPSRSP